MSQLPENILQKAMQQACAEARKWLGATSPNPAVGAAALNATGEVLAVAAHQRHGEAHAEAALLSLCKEKNLLAAVDTVCVTLEPCNHHGKTPPCSEALIQAGIKNVVIGTRDPNPKVKGGGVERLKEAGIKITSGILESECQQLIHAFAYKAKTGKPWITLKRAINQDGSMIPPPGQKTFTSQESLTLVHRMRKKADAILTGCGTILADDPLFTVRHVNDHKNKRRLLAIMDIKKEVPTSYLEAARDRGFDAICYQDINKALDDLTNNGAQDILVEAGPTLSDAIFDSHFWVMSVTMRRADKDEISIEFNPRAQLPFAPETFRWDYFLP